MAHPNAELIERFYEAMNRHDGAAMASCYEPNATFEDPAFGQLDAAGAGAMWRMLASRASDLHVELAERSADDTTGSAHWIAHYTFTQTGRPVVNDVRAGFRFRDGLIVEHRDDFDFYGWARQALGLPGLLLGWTPFMRAAFQRRARAMLDEFRAGEPV